MSKTEILTELPKLNVEERREIWIWLGQTDGFSDDELTESQTELLQTRMAQHEGNRQSAISWNDMAARLNRRLGV